VKDRLIEIENIFRPICSNLQLGIFSANVVVEKSSEALQAYIEAIGKSIAVRMRIEEVSERKQIAATRDVYRSLGKKPGRYRPSAEALNRRILNGKGWYNINNVVDLLNAISLETGWSIGGYNAAKIEGAIRLGVGQENEPYDAVGRGALNIAKLPLLRDDQGAFGSPTSDSTRTMIDGGTQQFLMIIFDFAGTSSLEEYLAKIGAYYEQFCSASNVQISTIGL
jgi:DNA/RNA-binding domain of Phe-tRNA-synthetase-like protein